MSQYYPFANPTDYTASFAVTASTAETASYFDYVLTASVAINGISGSIGLRGNPDICYITVDQYYKLLFTSSLTEVCEFPER